jgi:hypothetical protein
MRSVSFDYANTCPKIDKAILSAKSNITSHIDDVLSDACPLLPRDARIKFAEDYAERLFSDLEDIFEETRNTNEDMRHEAERQISDLKEEIANLESELSYLRDKE